MRGLLMIASACCLLAGSAQAAVIYQQAGSGTFLDIQYAYGGPGTYRLALTLSEPLDFNVYSKYTDHWDTFYAPPPRPHDEYIDGLKFDNVFMNVWEHSTGGTWIVTIPKGYRLFYTSGPQELADHSVPIGTPIYFEQRYENPITLIGGGADDGRTFDYSFSVTEVPEPEGWALLIVGFGMLGAALRISGRERGPRSAAAPPAISPI